MTDSHRTRFWRRLAAPLLRRGGTPFYLFSSAPVEEALAELEGTFSGLPVTHWLSVKTQPLPPLIRWWSSLGRPVEVVSELELQAALACGVPPESILVNGPAKHHWLPAHPLPGLRVNFDSPAEARLLAPQARRCGWLCGVRVATPSEFDPESPAIPTQFGLSGEELGAVIRTLRRAGIRPRTLHFHLRTQIPAVAVYQRAVAEALAMARASGLSPEVLDIGGGFPAPRVRRSGDPTPVDAGFSRAGMRRLLQETLRAHPGLREIWLENGRWISARSGVLVLRILDAKQRRGMRHLICDGGRTLHAMVSTWEDHDLEPLPTRSGRRVATTVTGPTCMAFDKLARRPLPSTLQPGDALLWMDAGAYHLPWETRFSHGLAAVHWHDGRKVHQVRSAETFQSWWHQWAPAP
ncbi:MAG TPA: hypothetical protein DCM86_15730 [Verrucomicrobiales bacterium]|nr:hypothetical protein [Verrucomicrobiales bacterium]